MDEERRALRARLDEAVERQDLAEIERALDALSRPEPIQITAEDPVAFSRRILKLQEERDRTMNHTKRTGRMLLIAAAAAAALSVGAYAAANWQRFSFIQDDRMVVVTGPETLTEQEAAKLAGQPPEIELQKPEAVALEGGALPEAGGMEIGREDISFSFVEDPDAPAADGAQVEVVKREKTSYATPEEAAEATGLPVALPKLPEGLELESVSGERIDGFSRTVWADYDGAGRHLGVTVDWTRRSEDSTVVAYHGIEPGSGGSYKTAKGYAFTTVREDGMDVATIFRGAYEYTLVFEGFSEAERRAVLDSVDLSADN